MIGVKKKAVTSKNGIRPNAGIYKILDVIANIIRSIPLTNIVYKKASEFNFSDKTYEDYLNLLDTTLSIEEKKEHLQIMGINELYFLNFLRWYMNVLHYFVP